MKLMKRAEWEQLGGVKFMPLPHYPERFVVFYSQVTSSLWTKLWALEDYDVVGCVDGVITLTKKDDQ